MCNGVNHRSQAACIVRAQRPPPNKLAQLHKTNGGTQAALWSTVALVVVMATKYPDGLGEQTLADPCPGHNADACTPTMCSGSISSRPLRKKWVESMLQVPLPCPNSTMPALYLNSCAVSLQTVPCVCMERTYAGCPNLSNQWRGICGHRPCRVSSDMRAPTYHMHPHKECRQLKSRYTWVCNSQCALRRISADMMPPKVEPSPTPSTLRPHPSNIHELRRRRARLTTPQLGGECLATTRESASGSPWRCRESRAHAQSGISARSSCCPPCASASCGLNV